VVKQYQIHAKVIMPQMTAYMKLEFALSFVVLTKSACCLAITESGIVSVPFWKNLLHE
jgi:hypothetical protein